MTSASAPVGASAWIQLLHAEVCWTLRQADVRPLVIKGPTIAEWLYPGEERISADADILIPPSEWARAVEALLSRGFVDYAEGVRGMEQTEHAQTLTRTDPDVGGHTVDLHRYFPGIDADAAEAFELLWGRSSAAEQAGVPVTYPDVPSRLLIVVLHAARGALTPKVLEDLRRAWRREGMGLFRSAGALASELDALPAFRVGLESVPETQHLVAELGLADVEVPPLWRLQNEMAPGTAIHLEQALERPWTERPGFVLRWLFPSPATMRLRDASVGEGPWALSRAYVSRLALGVRAVPSSVRAVRAARRN